MQRPTIAATLAAIMATAKPLNSNSQIICMMFKADDYRRVAVGYAFAAIA